MTEKNGKEKNMTGSNVTGISIKDENITAKKMGHAGETLKRFNYIVSELDALYHEAAVKLALSDSALNILYTICWVGDGCQQSDICRLSGISRQTINSAIGRLEQEGILLRKAGQGRKIRLFLTEKGHEIIAQKVQPLVDAEDQMLQSWEDNERKELIRLMGKYRDGFEEKVKHL